MMSKELYEYKTVALPSFCMKMGHKLRVVTVNIKPLLFLDIFGLILCPVRGDTLGSH